MWENGGRLKQDYTWLQVGRIIQAVVMCWSLTSSAGVLTLSLDSLYHSQPLILETGVSYLTPAFFSLYLYQPSILISPLNCFSCVFFLFCISQYEFRSHHHLPELLQWPLLHLFPSIILSPSNSSSKQALDDKQNTNASVQVLLFETPE